MQWPDYDTPIARIGRKGLRLSGAADQIAPEECLVYTNVRSRRQGPVEPRLGYQTIGSGLASPVHTIRRVEEPVDETYSRYIGAGTSVYVGQGAFTDLTGETGPTSGQPLSIVPYRTELSGSPWTLLTDPVMGPFKVRYVSGSYEVMPLGLTPPSVKADAELSDILTTDVAAFDSSDNSDSAHWTTSSGFSTADPEDLTAENPELTDLTAEKQGPAVEMLLKPGNVEGSGYCGWMAKTLDIDLTKLQGGTFDATEDDYFHMWVRCTTPSLLEEIRVYLVVSTGFDGSVLPGTDPEVNTDAYVKSIRPSDFQGFVETEDDFLTSAGRARRNTDVADYINRGGDTIVPPTVRDPEFGKGRNAELGLDPVDPSTPTVRYTNPNLPRLGPLPEPGSQLSLGRGVWSEFGSPGRPLRMRDFKRIGTDDSRNWGTVTGIIIVGVTNAAEELAMAFDDFHITGGFGPDSGPSDATPYDYRYTHYDTRSGAESNPSPIFEDADRLQPFRNRVTLQGTAYGTSAATYIHQRFYRRGGYLVDHWYFVGESETDGGEVVDTFLDTEIQTAGTVDLDNYRPIQSVDADGAGIRDNPAFLIGPLDGFILAGGCVTRPGHLNWCKDENPDAWPLENEWEVCAASEPLINGVMWGSSGFVFSQHRMYAIQSDGAGEMQTIPTACTPGLMCRGGLCITPYGLAYIAPDGIRLTSGGDSKLLSVAIDPLFRGDTAYGLRSIDWDAVDQMQLQSSQTELWFFYVDRDGAAKTLVYDFVDDQWSESDFASEMTTAWFEPELPGLVLGSTGFIAQEFGRTDDGAAIDCLLQTGYWNMGDDRKDKKLGDVVVDANLPVGTELTLLTRLNNGTTENTSQIRNGVGDRARYTFDPFGVDPQRARNVSLELSWSGSELAQLWTAGTAILLEPDVTYLRATTWQQMGPDGGMGYLTGLTITVDTGDVDKAFDVEYCFGVGSQAESHDVQVAFSSVVAADHAVRRIHFSWPAVRCDQARIRPTDLCVPWILYKIEWHVEPEPPYLSKWDSNHEAKGDQYHTGLDLVCDTYGVTKTVQIYVDQVLQTNPEGGTTWNVTATGKQLIHLTMTPGRGHIYRFVSTDDVRGHLYSWFWHLDPEPSEQHNWNQNYTPGGSLSDKWIKGVVLECDTFGQDKFIEIQVDHVTVETITVNQNDRGSVHVAFADQYLGRMLRLLPVDHNAGRIYQDPQWIFDLEPLKLKRWNTQELDFGLRGWFIVLEVMLSLRAESDVTLGVIGYNQSGTIILSHDYTIPNTGGVLKVKRFVPLEAMKCALVKFVAHSTTAFHFHREESFVTILPWGAMQSQTHPLGNDDLDPARHMGSATIASATPGGA